MKYFNTMLIAVALSAGMAFAQDAKQDMKNAGNDTKDAAKSAGKGIKKGSKHVIHKASGKTEEGAAKVNSKTR